MGFSREQPPSEESSAIGVRACEGGTSLRARGPESGRDNLSRSDSLAWPKSIRMLL